MEYIFLWIFTSLCLVRFTQCESVEDIQMVVLLPLNRSRLFSIQRVYPALEIAMEAVKERQLLPTFNLTLKYGDSNCSIADGMNKAIGFYARKEVDVFFGPCCDYAAAPVARQIRYWNMPMVTAGAMARDFGLVKKLMFPLMTRVGTTFDSLVEMIMTLLKRFHWRKVKLIYNPDGQAHIVDRFCHIVTDGVHHGLRTERTMGVFTHKYRKFHKKQDILDNLAYELGNSYGADEDEDRFANGPCLARFQTELSSTTAGNPKQTTANESEHTRILTEGTLFLTRAQNLPKMSLDIKII